MRRNGLRNGEELIEKWRFPRIRDVLCYIILYMYKVFTTVDGSSGVEVVAHILGGGDVH